MTKDTQEGANTLAEAISAAIQAAESLDLGEPDPADADQETALAELRRALSALNQAADAAAGVVVATGGDPVLRAITTQLPAYPVMEVDELGTQEVFYRNAPTGEDEDPPESPGL